MGSCLGFGHEQPSLVEKALIMKWRSSVEMARRGRAGQEVQGAQDRAKAKMITSL
jgi:hypothetical protein